MTLHQTVEVAKKAVLGTAIGVTSVIILVVVVRVGIVVKNSVFPPKIDPPSFTYSKLPAIHFPQNATKQQLVYKKNTLSGDLPDFPDRLNVFPISHPQPNFLNLQKAKDKIVAMGLTTLDGHAIPERALGNARYEWDEHLGFYRSIMINTVNFDFTLNSNYLASLTVLEAQNLSNEKDAIKATTDLLAALDLLPGDIDLTKTQNPPNDAKIVTNPTLFSVVNGTLEPATSLASAQVIRVDLYQKDLVYDLNTGMTNENKELKRIKQDLPVVYPHPPYSTMSFWIGSGNNDPQVMQANFTHQNIVIPKDTEATYAIKSAQEAFDELGKGQGYIAAYNGSNTEILVNNVFLAYYMGEETQDYLMPVVVFEGDNGFMAYVSAVQGDWIQ